MSDKDFRSDIDMWCDIWDNSQKEGVHPAAPKPKNNSAPIGGETTQDYYFDYLDIEDELIQEEKTPNPVYPDSVGPDCELDPKWAKEDFLKEIQSLKDKLFGVENKLAKMQAGDKVAEKAIVQDPQVAPNDNNLMSEIDSIRKKLEKISDHLGIENEASPWEIKRD